MHSPGHIVKTGVKRAAVKVAVKLSSKAVFNIHNPLADAAARAHAARMVTVITKETQQAIASVVARSFSEGIAPREIARIIKPMIGLNRQQAKAVMNARKEWAASGLTGDKLVSKVQRYSEKLIRQRALTISRTESIRAVSAGRKAAWEQAKDAGVIQSDRTSKQWDISPGACPEICEPMDGQQVPLDDQFETPDGELLDSPPAHPNCRCSVSLAFTS